MPISRRTIARAVGRWLGGAAVHLFPSRCFGCGGPLPRVQLLGACLTCWGQLAGCGVRRCDRCALPLPAGVTSSGPARACCARCVVRPPPFERAVAAVTYDAHARRFLLRAKDGRRPELLRPLAGQLAAALSISGAAAGVDGVVPVPSTLMARCRRGFDPARKLALEVADSSGLRLLDGVLRKRRIGGPPSKGLKASARWAWALRSVTPRRSVPGAVILLVDDVLTTGATAAACTVALRAAGAREVRLVVWARTPSPETGFDRTPGTRL